MSEAASNLSEKRTYRIQKAARLAGLSEEVLRAWERRYGLLKPSRTPGGFRVYSDEDIALLKRLKLLTKEGVAIGDAVRMVAAETVAPPPPEQAPGEWPIPGTALQNWRTGIIQAARQLDQSRVEQIVDEAFATLPPLHVVDELLIPVQREVGELWEAGKLTIAEEHLVTQALRFRLAGLLDRAPRRAKQHVLAACVPEEQHDLPLLAASLRLLLAGMKVTILGPRTPVEELARAVKKLSPDLVILSAVYDPGESLFKAMLDDLRAALPKATQVVFGGRAAEKYRSLVDGRGFRIFDGNWDRVLHPG